MARQIVSGFWEAMGTNDFKAAAVWLHPDFEYFMPQTNEYLVGPERFAQFNEAYPTEGRWVFDIRSLVCSENEAVSDVVVTDGRVNARAVTFHVIQDGLILRQKEFWPEDYSAPEWRAQWMTVVSEAPF
jgi:hypothetical protein